MDNIEVLDTHIFNMMQDLKKKEFEPRERALQIEWYMKKNKLSLRELADKIDVPHTTIHGWLSVLQFTEEEYIGIKKKGYNNADIMKAAKYKEQRRVSVSMTVLERDLVNCIDVLKHYSKGDNVDKKSAHSIKSLLHELRDILNRIEMKVER